MLTSKTLGVVAREGIAPSTGTPLAQVVGFASCQSCQTVQISKDLAQFWHKA